MGIWDLQRQTPSNSNSNRTNRHSVLEIRESDYSLSLLGSPPWRRRPHVIAAVTEDMPIRSERSMAGQSDRARRWNATLQAKGLIKGLSTDLGHLPFSPFSSWLCMTTEPLLQAALPMPPLSISGKSSYHSIPFFSITEPRSTRLSSNLSASTSQPQQQLGFGQQSTNTNTSLQNSSNQNNNTSSGSATVNNNAITKSTKFEDLPEGARKMIEEIECVAFLLFRPSSCVLLGIIC